MYLANGSLTSLDTVTVSNNQLSGNNPQGQGIYEQDGAQLIIGEGVYDFDDPNGQPVQGP